MKQERYSRLQGKTLQNSTLFTNVQSLQGGDLLDQKSKSPLFPRGGDGGYTSAIDHIYRLNYFILVETVNKKIIKCLVPSTVVPDIAVLKVVSWLCTRKPTLGVQVSVFAGTCLYWLLEKKGKIFLTFEMSLQISYH